MYLLHAKCVKLKRNPDFQQGAWLVFHLEKAPKSRDFLIKIMKGHFVLFQISSILSSALDTSVYLSNTCLQCSAWFTSDLAITWKLAWKSCTCLKWKWGYFCWMSADSVLIQCGKISFLLLSTLQSECLAEIPRMKSLHYSLLLTNYWRQVFCLIWAGWRERSEQLAKCASVVWPDLWLVTIRIFLHVINHRAAFWLKKELFIPSTLKYHVRTPLKAAGALDKDQIHPYFFP